MFSRLDGPFNYYCLDAASLLPVLMMDIQSGDHVLDICSSPGGKALAMAQTLKPSRIVCNDIGRDRVARVKQVMNSYHYDKFNEAIGKDVIQYSNRDALNCPKVFEEQFDKVLCDVPCFTDRHILFNEEGNLFASHRSRERLRMPELQAAILM